MKKLSINNINMAYSDVGQGPPILLIHGIYSSQQQWQPQVKTLATNYRVITCDLRGHGYSSDSKEEYSVALFARDVLGLLDELGLERVVCCGHSFGGLVVQELALSHPERVRGIILAETMYGLNSTPWDAAMAVTTNVWLPQLVGVKNYVQLVAKFFGIFTPGGADYIMEEAQRHLADEVNQEKIMWASLKFDSRWRLHQINCPTLLMVGQYPHIPLILWQNWEMYWRIRGARLKIIPLAGHLLFWDNPAAFNKEIVQFMDSL